MSSLNQFNNTLYSNWYVCLCVYTHLEIIISTRYIQTIYTQDIWVSFVIQCCWLRGCCSGGDGCVYFLTKLQMNCVEWVWAPGINMLKISSRPWLGERCQLLHSLLRLSGTRLLLALIASLLHLLQGVVEVCMYLCVCMCMYLVPLPIIRPHWH